MAINSIIDWPTELSPMVRPIGIDVCLYKRKIPLTQNNPEIERVTVRT